ncbi:outer membrane protein [Methylocapsa sp. S129]|uniref:outer membrane protein n=1 Tax=Methylocapsa sp. S129 TaxID=1641869 RepID=UPI00131C3F0A|nr:outer membrane beta-barrel protein [Methylocapsa sp. S129]
MKKLLVGLFFAVSGIAAAAAADLSARSAPPPLPPPAFSWTGFYVGVNGGRSSTDPTFGYTPNDFNALFSTCGSPFGTTCVPSASFNMNGSLAGGQIGYNYQFNPSWMVGAEADYDWSNIHGSANSNFILGSVGPSTFVAKETVESFGTFRGRLGFIPTPPLLLFVTGGLAYGTVDGQSAMAPGVGDNGSGDSFGHNTYRCYDPISCFSGKLSETRVGWTLGAGGEYAITNNITVKAEYLYANLGRPESFNAVATMGFGAPSSFAVSSSAVSLNIVRAGLNWKF